MLIESEDFKEISKETLHFHGAVRNRRNRPKIRRNRSKSHGNVRNQEKISKSDKIIANRADKIR